MWSRGVYVAPWCGDDGEMVLIAVRSDGCLNEPPRTIPSSSIGEDSMSEDLHGYLSELLKVKARSTAEMQARLDVCDPIPAIGFCTECGGAFTPASPMAVRREPCVDELMERHDARWLARDLEQFLQAHEAGSFDGPGHPGGMPTVRAAADRKRGSET